MLIFTYYPPILMGTIKLIKATMDIFVLSVTFLGVFFSGQMTYPIVTVSSGFIDMINMSPCIIMGKTEVSLSLDFNGTVHDIQY